MTDTSVSRPATTMIWAVLALILAPWVWIRAQLTTHSDILWLCEVAKRYFSGSDLASDGFETNPPLSMLLYAGPVLLQMHASVPIHITVFIQSLAILGIGTIALVRILKDFKGLSDGAALTLIIGYVLANTVLSAFHFGERDHLIGMALVPFALLQLSLTYRLGQMSAGRWAFCIFAAVLLLLKPQFGLIPIVLLLHRMMRDKSLRFLRDPDFIVLTVVTLSYAAVLLTFFQQYLFVILPDVVRYYYISADTTQTFKLTGSMAVLTLCVYGIMHGASLPEQDLRIGKVLTVLAALCLIPVVLQSWGFYYHFLPTILCLVMAVALTVYGYAGTRITTPVRRVGTVGLLLSVIAYLMVPLPFYKPRHDTYTALPLAQEIITATQNHTLKSFFIFNTDMGLMGELAYYTGVTHASRFSGLWFLPGFYYYQEQRDAGRMSAAESERLDHDIERFSKMIADDFNRYQPAIVFIVSPKVFDGKIDMIGFFKDQPDFKQAWSHYRFDQDLMVKKSDYGSVDYGPEGTPFKVYRRID